MISLLFIVLPLTYLTNEVNQTHLSIAADLFGFLHNPELYSQNWLAQGSGKGRDKTELSFILAGGLLKGNLQAEV